MKKFQFISTEKLIILVLYVFFFVCLLFIFMEEAEAASFQAFTYHSTIRERLFYRMSHYGYELPEDLLVPFGYRPQIYSLGIGGDNLNIRFNLIRMYMNNDHIPLEYRGFVYALCDTEAYIRYLYRSNEIEKVVSLMRSNSFRNEDHCQKWIDYLVEELLVKGKYGGDPLNCPEEEAQEYLRLANYAFELWKRLDVQFYIYRNN